jgi:hypothetical protein
MTKSSSHSSSESDSVRASSLTVECENWDSDMRMCTCSFRARESSSDASRAITTSVAYRNVNLLHGVCRKKPPAGLSTNQRPRALATSMALRKSSLGSETVPDDFMRMAVA